MNALILTLAAVLAALVGGFIALRGRKRLNLALGFTAGLILGLVAFELLPEIYRIAINQKLDIIWPMLALVGGFLAIHVVEKSALIHSSQENKYEPHAHQIVGVSSALALCAHSLLDGLSIGLGFQLDAAVGTTLAIAVIGHRFADGFSTTNVLVSHGSSTNSAKKLLYFASVMPIVGLALSYLISLPDSWLAIYLGFFAGLILYIGASDILPQAHSKKSSTGTIVMTILGVLFMLLVSQVT